MNEKRATEWSDALLMVSAIVLPLVGVLLISAQCLLVGWKRDESTLTTIALVALVCVSGAIAAGLAPRTRFTALAATFAFATGIGAIFGLVVIL